MTEHSEMGVISPHDSPGNMCIMWVNLVQIFPFSDHLLTQQQFKVTHIDFGTAHDSRGVHISPRYFVESR